MEWVCCGTDTNDHQASTTSRHTLSQYFPLISPAVYYVAQSLRVPVVQTLHNYRLLCPAAVFFRDGHPCEDCMGTVTLWPSVVHGCYQGSRTATAVAATMLGLHRFVSTWNSKVDVYIALTEFARQKFIEGGLPDDKIVVKPNFLYPPVVCGEGQGGYALFVGRLVPEKGNRSIARRLASCRK